MRSNDKPELNDGKQGQLRQTDRVELQLWYVDITIYTTDCDLSENQ